MILVPRWVAIGFVLLVLAAVLGLGLVSYYTIGSDSEQPEVKASAERVLFLSIVAAVILLLLLVILYARTEYVSRELDKMVELNKFGDYSPEVSMRKLGKIGEKITQLYFRLNALNEKRALKISALSDLVQLLATNVSTPLFVGDVTGEILYASRNVGEKFGKSRAELLNSAVPDVLPAVNLQTIISRLDRTKRAEAIVAGGESISIVPVYNRKNELGYLVWAFTKDGLHIEGTELPAPVVVSNGMGSVIRRMFARSGSKKT